MNTRNLLASLLMVLIVSCTVIEPGFVGVKSKFGKLQGQVLEPGAYFTGFGTRLIVMPIGTKNIEINLNLPSKEGLKTFTLEGMTVSLKLITKFMFAQMNALQPVFTADKRQVLPFVLLS